jgi:hypothetical protein
MVETEHRYAQEFTWFLGLHSNNPNKNEALIGLAVMDRAARCRLLANGQVITLRAGKLWDVVPGGIVTGKPRKQMINLYKARNT